MCPDKEVRSSTKEAACECGDEGHFNEQPDEGFKSRQDSERVVQRDTAWEEAAPVK